jgi:alpha-tubulin suppressor-like RCC1 family protein
VRTELRLLALGSLLLVSTISACSDLPSGSETQTLSALQVSANVAGTAISTLVITVSAPDLPAPLTFNLEVVNGTASGTLKVPPGAARLVEVDAYDTAGEITHEGSKTVDVARGSNPPLFITLMPKAGQVPITITVGNYSVVISPGSAALAVGETQQLSATITSTDGEVVNQAVVWATLNPSIATVSSDGLVKALAEGQVQIVATYEGIAGASLIVIGEGPVELTLQHTISAGGYHSCGLTPFGAAYCWGRNEHGQLGDGTFTDRTSPVAVLNGQTFTSISAGFYHSCALTASGEVYCWGNNELGQLGDGTRTRRAAPVPVSGGQTFRRLSAGGGFHTCALTGQGVAYCWGHNVDGQIGDGTTTDRTAPEPVAGGYIFSRIRVGLHHTCALSAAEDGTLRPHGDGYCWGDNTHGQLGDGTTTDRTSPAAIVGGHIFSQLSPGQFHSCGLNSSGTAYCWGRNSNGQLGDGTYANRASPGPVVGGLTFSRLSAALTSNCALTTAGTAYCWGYNGYGQLGDGTYASRTAPVAVAGGLTFTTTSAGAMAGCALTTSGTAYCWGSNEYGQLGDGTTTARPYPAAVTGGFTFGVN